MNRTPRDNERRALSPLQGSIRRAGFSWGWRPWLSTVAPSGLVLLVTMLAASVGASGAEITAEQRTALAKALEPLHAQYDPAERMIRRPFSSPGYHTTLKGGMVHPTRESARYAAALFDLDDPAMHRRACEILEKVISLQDQDPASKTYGIWSWFLEEPLAKMSPPDWNWADFCGRELLQVKLHHEQKVPAELMKKVDASIRHAAASIRKRNVGPGYTNIAILGTYVTLVAAEAYGDKELFEYATARLKRVHEYTMQQGGFTEYNSPTYTLVSLKALAGLRSDVKDEASRKLASELYRMSWEEIATHWHAPTRQWAGPHSRSYSTLLRDSALATIQNGTGVDLGQSDAAADVESYRFDLSCPADLVGSFKTLEGPRSLVKTFVKGERPVVGTTYLHPQFTLGSVNRGDFWNQRRPIVAYWGTREKPAYFTVRVLKDGYDFAAAQFFSVQKENHILGAIVFATDGGVTHVSLDRMKDGVFKAKDLRVRFEFGGAAKISERQTNLGHWAGKFATPGLDFYLDKVGAMSGTEVRTEEGEHSYDVVLHAGQEKEFRLTEIETAYLGFVVVLLPSGTEAYGFTLLSDRKNGRISLRHAAKDLRLSFPVKPMKAGEIAKSVSAE